MPAPWIKSWVVPMISAFQLFHNLISYFAKLLFMLSHINMPINKTFYCLKLKLSPQLLES